MTNDELTAALDDLRCELMTMNGNPLLPQAVKMACNTTFRILSELIRRGAHGEN